MTAALIALFAGVALCALIGWAFVRILTIVARGLRRRSAPPRRADEPRIVFRYATPQEMAERTELRRKGPTEGAVETYFENGRWKNKIHGNTRASRVHETREAAVSAGREMARKRGVEHVIKKEDGTTEGRSDHDESQSVPG